VDNKAFDLVVMYLGGNDWFSVGKKQSLEDSFIKGYVEFLRSVRAMRPNTPLLVLRADQYSGSSMGSAAEQAKYASDMERLLTRACVEAGGESNLIYLSLVDLHGAISLKDDSDWATMMHWSAASHRKWASGVVPLVEGVTGWKALGSVSRRNAGCVEFGIRKQIGNF
jgi:hypothetical protein